MGNEGRSKKIQEILTRLPVGIDFPKEMVPIWAGMLIPHWMLALQAGFTVAAHEAMRNIPDQDLGILSAGILGLAV